MYFQEERLQAKLREEQERNNALLEKQERQIRKANSIKESKEVEQITVSWNLTLLFLFNFVDHLM